MTDHPEAFCLMRYTSDDGTEEEVVWNSRDGVTPFVISLRSGKQATHVAWTQDITCSEEMARALKVRWFIDHTADTAQVAAAAYVDRFWDHPEIPMSKMYADRNTAIGHFIAEYIGTPTLTEAS